MLNLLSTADNPEMLRRGSFHLRCMGAVGFASGWSNASIFFISEN